MPVARQVPPAPAQGAGAASVSGIQKKKTHPTLKNTAVEGAGSPWLWSQGVRGSAALWPAAGFSLAGNVHLGARVNKQLRWNNKQK